MVCKEKQRLFEEYVSFTEDYLALARELLQDLETLSKEDYDARYQTTEAIFHDVAAARIMLQAHVLGCRC